MVSTNGATTVSIRIQIDLVIGSVYRHGARPITHTSLTVIVDTITWREILPAMATS